MNRLVCVLCLNLLVSSTSATTIIDFLKYQGITYESHRFGVGRDLRESDLGPEITRVKYKFVWDGIHPGKQPDHGPEDAFAASLEIGAPVYQLKEYSSIFRLASRRKGRIVLFEVSRVPNATSGMDYLDLRNLEYLGIISGEDGVTELGAIKGAERINELVVQLAEAPVVRNQGAGPAQHFLAFHFRDGTASLKACSLDFGKLWPDILLPEEFVQAIKDAIPERGREP